MLKDVNDYFISRREGVDWVAVAAAKDASNNKRLSGNVIHGIKLNRYSAACYRSLFKGSHNAQTSNMVIPQDPAALDEGEPVHSEAPLERTDADGDHTEGVHAGSDTYADERTPIAHTEESHDSHEEVVEKDVGVIQDVKGDTEGQSTPKVQPQIIPAYTVEQPGPGEFIHPEQHIPHIPRLETTGVLITVERYLGMNRNGAIGGDKTIPLQLYPSSIAYHGESPCINMRNALVQIAAGILPMLERMDRGTSMLPAIQYYHSVIDAPYNPILIRHGRHTDA